MAGTEPCSYVVRQKKRVGPYCIILEKQFNCFPLQTIPFTAHCGFVKLFLDFFNWFFAGFYLFFSCRAVIGFSDVPARPPGGGERVVGQREEREREKWDKLWSECGSVDSAPTINYLHPPFKTARLFRAFESPSKCIELKYFLHFPHSPSANNLLLYTEAS